MYFPNCIKIQNLIFHISAIKNIIKIKFLINSSSIKNNFRILSYKLIIIMIISVTRITAENFFKLSLFKETDFFIILFCLPFLILSK